MRFSATDYFNHIAGGTHYRESERDFEHTEWKSLKRIASSLNMSRKELEQKLLKAGLMEERQGANHRLNRPTAEAYRSIAKPAKTKEGYSFILWHEESLLYELSLDDQH